VDTFESVLDTLFYINQTDQTATNAESLRKEIANFDFVFVLHTLRDVFDRTGRFSVTLQDREMEIDRMTQLKAEALVLLTAINQTLVLRQFS